MRDQISYSPELRERAVRLVFEQQKEHELQWSAIKSIASDWLHGGNVTDMGKKSGDGSENSRRTVDIGS